jgi:Zn-dependent protease
MDVSELMTPEKMRMIFTGMIALVLSISLHEFGHAFVAVKLGDQLPRQQGRLTLNPMAHADPIGTLLLPFLGMVFAAPLLGWGKPVEVRPERFTRKLSVLTSHMLVALAGPVMNVLFGTLIAAVFVTLLATNVIAPGQEIASAFYMAILLNFTLFFFNMLPVPPLDGGTVARRVLPRRHHDAYEKVVVYGPFIILAMLMISPLRKIITIPAAFLAENVVLGFARIAGIA